MTVVLGAFETLEVTRDGHVGWLVLNRPDVLNAMGAQMLDELPEAWRLLDADPEVRVVVVTGTGRGFCTGVDVKEIAGNPALMAEHARKTRENDLGITSLHCGVFKPVVCAVNGVCAGGGLHFVADSDIVVAAAGATFSDPHVSVGQVSSWEPIGLARKMPFDAVARLLFLGRHEVLGAERALELGMIGEIVDPPERLRAHCQELAERIALNSPSAMMVSKRLLWDSLNTGLDASLTAGASALAAFWRHPDAREGPRAFAERREPRWEPPAAPEEERR